MKRFYLILAICLAILFLSSCTPQKRLSRLIKLHPELTTTDTIKITDTIITKKTRIDTAFHRSKIKDTVTIEREKLKLEIIEVFDTLYIETQYDSDTIIIEKEVPVEKIINDNSARKKSDIDKFLEKKWVWVVFGTCFILITLAILKKSE